MRLPEWLIDILSRKTIRQEMIELKRYATYILAMVVQKVVNNAAQSMTVVVDEV